MPGSFGGSRGVVGSVGGAEVIVRASVLDASRSTASSSSSSSSPALSGSGGGTPAAAAAAAAAACVGSRGVGGGSVDLHAAASEKTIAW